MARVKRDWLGYWPILLYILLGLAALVVAGLQIYGLIVYRNTPVNEVPWWVWWISR